MDNFFTEPERVFLKNLGEDPIWVGIINKMTTFSKTPRYQVKVKMPVENQTSDWVYNSGKLDEREIILSLLTLRDKKINLEK